MYVVYNGKLLMLFFAVMVSSKGDINPFIDAYIIEHFQKYVRQTHLSASFVKSVWKGPLANCQRPNLPSGTHGGVGGA